MGVGVFDSIGGLGDTTSGRGLTTQLNYPKTFASLKQMRACKEAIREHTMRRIESMGLKVPTAWKDELYRNELTKMDIRRELAAKDRIAVPRENAEQDAVEGTDYRLRFNLEKYQSSFFDRSLKNSYKNFQ